MQLVVQRFVGTYRGVKSVEIERAKSLRAQLHWILKTNYNKPTQLKNFRKASDMVRLVTLRVIRRFAIDSCITQLASASAGFLGAGPNSPKLAPRWAPVVAYRA